MRRPAAIACGASLDGNAEDADAHPRRPGLARPSRWPARGRAADGRGWLPGRSGATPSRPRRRTHRIVLTVERLDDGEVSPYLTDVLAVGIGSSCVARSAATSSGTSAAGGPLLLVAGGSGMVPLMAMLRHRAAVGSAVPARLLYSSRAGRRHLPWRARALAARDRPGSEVVHTLTREQPAAGRATRPHRRRAARGGRLAARRAAARLRLRADPARRGGRGASSSSATIPHASRPSVRTDRSDRATTATPSPALALELFGREMTLAIGVCRSAETSISAFAELHVYVAAGFVARCPACDAVLLRIVEGRDRTWMDLGGLATLDDGGASHMPPPPPPPPPPFFFFFFFFFFF